MLSNISEFVGLFYSGSRHLTFAPNMWDEILLCFHILYILQNERKKAKKMYL
jgi:hypothetical protein